MNQRKIISYMKAERTQKKKRRTQQKKTRSIFLHNLEAIMPN